ncbi:MAG: FAD:protein FMN transferase [Thermodesulfobacteriota bacterium]|jgi:thiamine biosynthesis lipoprotein
MVSLPYRPLLLAALVSFGLSLPRAALGCQSDGRYVMGTVLEITLCPTGPDQPAQDHHLFDALFATATRLDTLFTTFIPTSPLSRLNAQAGRGAVTVPPELVDILSVSLQYWHLTKGTFDVTVGPLVALWRRAGETQTFPSPTAVRQARARVGSDNITLSRQGQVALARHGMAIDLGGIGKGYALDQLVSLLKARNVRHALLDFGQSSLWALGQPPAAPGWRLLLRQPNGQFAGIITLRDQALSVSGSFGQTFEVHGRQYGHVIDPRSGEPLRRDLLACVIAPNAAQAEALSKALLILGEQDGIPLLEHLPGVEGLLLEANGQRWMTAGWEQATAFAAM